MWEPAGSEHAPRLPAATSAEFRATACCCSGAKIIQWQALSRADKEKAELGNQQQTYRPVGKVEAYKTRSKALEGWNIRAHGGESTVHGLWLNISIGCKGTWIVALLTQGGRVRTGQMVQGRTERQGQLAFWGLAVKHPVMPPGLDGDEPSRVMPDWSDV